MVSDKLGQYLTLISSFVTAKISVTDFERNYLKLFKGDATQWPDAEFIILDELFGAVDAFCADAQLRDEKDLDEYELKERCRTALEKLQALAFVNA